MANGLLTAFSLLSRNLQLDLASKCFVDLWVGRDLVARDGSLARVIRIDGLKELKSFLDLETFLTKASQTLNSPLNQRGPSCSDLV